MKKLIVIILCCIGITSCDPGYGRLEWSIINNTGEELGIRYRDYNLPHVEEGELISLVLADGMLGWETYEMSCSLLWERAYPFHIKVGNTWYEFRSTDSSNPFSEKFFNEDNWFEMTNGTGRIRSWVYTLTVEDIDLIKKYGFPF